MRISLYIICLVILSLILVHPAVSENVIYDNITTSQYKTLQVTSDLCLTDCEFTVYIDGFLMGNVHNNEVFQVPNNSDVRVTLYDPINTNLESSWDLGKTYFGIALMWLIGGVAVVLIVGGAVWFSWRRGIRRGRR